MCGGFGFEVLAALLVGTGGIYGGLQGSSNAHAGAERLGVRAASLGATPLSQAGRRAEVAEHSTRAKALPLPQAG